MHTDNVLQSEQTNSYLRVYHLSQDADKRNILPAFVLIVGINGNLMLQNSFAIRNTRIEAILTIL
jgi:hypothetical protein